MKAEHINPFIESVYQLFSTMLNAQVDRGEIGLAHGGGNPRDILALIGFGGPARGTLALSFPVNTALAMAGRLIGRDIRVVDETVSDAVAEIVNIVAGGAKAKFCPDGGRPIDLSLPTVVRGNSYSVDYPSQSRWLDIPFTSELGEFSLRVIFELE